MSSVKMKGRTVEEATEAALQVLSARRDEVDVKVLKEGKGAVLGIFGGEEAEVEVSLSIESAEKGRRVLQEILDLAGFIALVSVVREEGDYLYLEVKGEDMGRIIGKNGATLTALQILVSSILSRQAQKRCSVLIDAEGYRKRQEERAARIATEAIDEAVSAGKEVTLPPMDAAERRLVHMAVKEDGRATSFSRGEGSDRRIVISTQKEDEGGKPSA